MTQPKNSEVITAELGLIRFGYQGKVAFGQVKHGIVRVYDGSPFGAGKPGATILPLNDVHLLAPCRPSKIVAVGLNYKAHAAELGLALPDEPMLFIKPATAVIGPNQAIKLPAMSQRVDYECELGVVIGRRCKGLSPKQAREHVIGYTCLNDVTARDLQKKSGQFTRAKGFDTFCPLGPVIAQDIEPGGLRVRTLVNGQQRQDGHTSDLIFSVFNLVSFISQVMTLNAGDVIATGTPAGIGPLQAGDVATIEVQGVGSLVNPVSN